MRTKKYPQLMKVLSGIIPEGAFFNSFDTVEHFFKSLKGHFERNQYNNRGGFIYENYGQNRE